MNIQTREVGSEVMVPTVEDLRARFSPYLFEMEINRALPAGAIEELRKIGVFRMFAPDRFGGLELAFPTALELVRRIAMIDGSIGWIAAINSGAAIVLPRLPLSALEEVYKNGPDQVVAGSAQARGVGMRVAGGWRVSGRWPLASGCKAANWMIAGFKNGDADPDDKSAGTKQILLPARQFTVEDTWKVMGLRGTGSHHIAIEDAFVSDDFVLTLGPGKPCVDAPLYRHPAHLIALGHGAVHLGIARAAIADLVDLQREKPADTSGKREFIQFELGKAHGKLRAAQGAFDLQVRSNWADACDDVPMNPVTLGDTIQILVHIAAETLSIVRSCFELGGSAAVYEDSPLQRRLRDIQVATQHSLIQKTNWMAGGKVLLSGDGDALLNALLPGLGEGNR